MLMNSLAIPPKTRSSSMDNGLPAQEPSSFHSNDHVLSLSGNDISAVERDPQASLKPKPRPPVAPKPKLSVERREQLASRGRTMSVTDIRSPQRKQLKPPILPRHMNIRTPPPPKPPRINSVVFSDEKDDQEESFIDNYSRVELDIPDTSGDIDSDSQPTIDEEQSEEEYDLTQRQLHATAGGGIDFSPHRLATRAMSQPLPPHPNSKHQSRPSITSSLAIQSGPNERTRLIERYHDLQRKHLPLFKSMTLIELAQKYAKFFPLKIQVTEGHYGMSSKFSISTDDRFNVHFKKRMKNITIQTHGEEYFIPLSSAIQFGLVYDPSDDQTQAMEGYRFRRVADLMGSNPLPKIVCVISPCSCSNGVFLEHNELLVVKKVKKSLFRGRPMLKVLSLLTMTKKLLPEEAIGDFTTKPLCIKLNLPQFLEHIPKPFPSKAMMYLDKDDGSVDVEEILPYMFSWPVVLKEVKRHKSLVATPEKSQQLIDIPLQGNIGAVRVTIVPPNNPEDIQELFTNTKRFLRRFDVTQMDIYGEFHTETAHDTQNTFYRIVRGSIKDLGVEVVTPEALRKDGQQHHRNVQQGQDGGDDTDSFTSSNSGDHIYATLPGSVCSDEEYETLEQVHIRPILSATATGPDLLDKKPLEVNRNVPIPIPRKPRKRSETSLSGSGGFRFSRIANRSNLSPPSEPLTGGHRSVSLGQLTNTELLAQEFEENRQYLKTLSIQQVSLSVTIQYGELLKTFVLFVHIISFLCGATFVQVGDLLDAMNLGKYTASFKEQHISGDLLAELTDNMLHNDLGIESDLHRLRLIKVIKGEHSVHRIFKHSPSYCHLTKNACN